MTTWTDEQKIALWHRIGRIAGWMLGARRQEVEDVRDEVWAKFAAKAEQDGWHEPFTVAIMHRVIDEIRKIGRAQRALPLIEELDVPKGGKASDGVGLINELLEKVKLTSLEGRVIYYSFFRGETLRAMSAILDISKEEVLAYRAEAIRKLREAAEELARSEEL